MAGCNRIKIKIFGILADGLVSIVANSDGDKQDELVVNKKETNQPPHAM